MNTKEHLIISVNQNSIITKDVKNCSYDEKNHKYHVQFMSGKECSYLAYNLKWLQHPVKLNPSDYEIWSNGKMLYNIAEIYEFRDVYEVYWHICFDKGKEYDYKKSNLEIHVSALKDAASQDVFAYLKQIAELSNLGEDEKILPKYYQKITFIDKGTLLADYLNPPLEIEKVEREETILFPFGCNASQFQAVKNALENKCSVIEGPPGTGKTQTILNILANLLVSGKTIQVVSNNNSAIENVLEKLSSPKYALGFIVAFLGNSENKERFISHQDENYPDISAWEDEEAGKAEFAKEIAKISEQLDSVFSDQETLARTSQELSALETEEKHFENHMTDLEVTVDGLGKNRKVGAERLIQQLLEYQELLDQEKHIGLVHKLKGMLWYGMLDRSFYDKELSEMIMIVQRLYYQTRKQELQQKIETIEKRLQNVSADQLMDRLCQMSMRYLKHKLYQKYSKKEKRRKFSRDDLRRNPAAVLEEYPVTLSTTFSAKVSLGNNVIYDYLIMDEASQIDVATGALALSGAKNAVIVGDLKQLPNVVKPEDRKLAEEIFSKFCINEGYHFAKNSFLKSICTLMPNVPRTMLREHYRCHPQIIEFCNQRFYSGQLVIMTQDLGEKDTLWVDKAPVGDHQRGHVNQRQIDMIKNEILPTLSVAPEEIGIIAPYRDQVKTLKKQVNQEEKSKEQNENKKKLGELKKEFEDIGIQVDTVHKFQGREKDTIILTTVDDEFSAFSDDPYLLNVAISRAKKRFFLVVSGNEQPKGSNISELISYIEYHKFKVTESKVCSVFDYLYKQYTEARQEFLKDCKSGSRYDSERLMYKTVQNVLKEEGYTDLNVAGPVYLRDILRNIKKGEETELWMSDREREYIAQGAHVDLLVYSCVGKIPILTIEVDGTTFHKEGSPQAKRDEMKDRILEHYGLKPLRFPTNGSGEKETVQKELAKKGAEFENKIKMKLEKEWR